MRLERRKPMAITLRWHISRLYQGSGSVEDDARTVGVTITRQATDILQAANVDTLDQLAAVTKREDLGWWEKKEDKQIEGLVAISALKDILIARSLPENTVSPSEPQEGRELMEDMVFLQLVRDESALENELQKLRDPNVKGLPDVERVAHIKNSVWLDFTQQARRMSATLYSQALGEREEDGNASQR
jgi:hypothetical protein